ILRLQGRIDESLAAQRWSVAIEPHPDYHSMLLMTMQYADDVTPQSLLAAHRQWEAAYARPAATPTPPGLVRRDADRPLKIGFVSEDFGLHPMGFLWLNALEHFDKTQCQVICYSD